MRDRHVRRIVLGLILVFPVLVTWMSPAPPSGVRARGVQALLPLAAVEVVLVAGLYGASRMRQSLLAGRGDLACEPRKSLTPAHFVPSTTSPVLEATPR